MTKKFLKLLLIVPVLASINTVNGYTGKPNGWNLDRYCEKDTYVIGLVWRSGDRWGVHKYNKWNGSSKWIKRNVDEAKARAKYYSRCY